LLMPNTVQRLLATQFNMRGLNVMLSTDFGLAFFPILLSTRHYPVQDSFKITLQLLINPKYRSKKP
jgi:hypothetical protein